MMHPVRDYHERSKHHLDRYAPGPGMLDWPSQPDPFRRYCGTSETELPLLEGELGVPWGALFGAVRPAPRPLDRDHIAQLLELSLGLSAWKSYAGSRWALRCNPSSGNLHPTEGYLICPELVGLAAGVHHYRPDAHSLEHRAAAPLAWSGGVFVALTGIHWREAWKYGMRAFRYCQHDCGHALAALAYAAAALGWSSQLVEDWDDDQLAALTGIDRRAEFPPDEAETPEALLWIGAGPVPAARVVCTQLADARWVGRANVLSSTHRDWPDIALVAAATRRPDPGTNAAAGVADRSTVVDAWPPLPPLAAASLEPFSRVVRRRRSAQAFDGVTRLAASHFFGMLDALLPRPGVPPWSLLAPPPQVHPVFLVHRVDGVAPGVYCLPRSTAALATLRAAMRSDWLWDEVPECPKHLPLRLLAPLDVRPFAAAAACHQDIAGDSAFAVAMLARFDDLAASPWRYRQRFWEAGLLGQVLYLEAEAAGVQGTGIGCYFDDTVHHALGLDTERFQDLYHFTVGGAHVDVRLRSEAPYAHLTDRIHRPDE